MVGWFPVRLLPPLRYSHPNFFVVYAATAFFHLVFGLMHWLEPGRFAGPVYELCYWVMPVKAWGTASVLVWLLMTLGVFWSFTYARIGLAVGFFLTLSRGLLIEMADPEAIGAGLLAWGLIAMQHLSQLREPPANPLSAR